MPGGTDHSADRHGNLIALGVVLAVLVLLGLLAYRPATVLGVDEESLANSMAVLGGKTVGNQCSEWGGDEWLCRLSDGSSAEGEYRVSTRAFGCWDATLVSDVPGHPPATGSGCVNAFHLVF
jgi:hypothetical protein